MLKILVITTPFQFYSQQLNYLNVSSAVKMNIFQFTNILLPLEQFCFHYLSLPIMCIKNQNPHKVIPNQSSGVRYYLLIFLSSLTRETMYILIVKIYSVIYIYIYIYIEIESTKKHYILGRKSLLCALQCFFIRSLNSTQS